VPNAPNKQESLVNARKSCEGILSEVEELLAKYPSLGSPNKKLIDRFKFIARDIDGLKERLDRCGDELQKCLTSLMSVSMVNIEDKLDILMAEYRAGKHEKSVISLALVEGQKLDEKEAMDQVEADLLDKDVHPDAIDMHQPYVKQWLL